jgi:hypothetical protein
MTRITLHMVALTAKNASTAPYTRRAATTPAARTTRAEHTLPVAFSAHLPPTACIPLWGMLPKPEVAVQVVEQVVAVVVGMVATAAATSKAKP